MLTEKEIVQLLAELPPTHTISSCRFAAHIIRERLKEGVVWEGEDEADLHIVLPDDGRYQVIVRKKPC